MLKVSQFTDMFLSWNSGGIEQPIHILTCHSRKSTGVTWICSVKCHWAINDTRTLAKIVTLFIKPVFFLLTPQMSAVKKNCIWWRRRFEKYKKNKILSQGSASDMNVAFRCFFFIFIKVYDPWLDKNSDMDEILFKINYFPFCLLPFLLKHPWVMGRQQLK